MLELSFGNVFAHRFIIEKQTKSGGMGLVYRARDRHTNRPVALKLLRHEANSTEIDRFMREARTLSDLRHSGIVSYIAHGISGEGEPYLAMEWLEGEDLAQRLRRLSLNVSEVLILLRCIAEALEVAHQADILHRDIKPSNLFLRDGRVDRVTLIDFGLARRSVGGAQVTQVGVVVGTPEYMAPEQARGDLQIGPSVDIFALGCVAFECLTGQPPFVSEHIATVLAKILFEEAPPLCHARPDLPAPLGKLLARMLAKNPAARISGATALRQELVAFEELSLREPPRNASTTGHTRFEMAGGEQVLVSIVVAQSDGGHRENRMTIDPAQYEDARSRTSSLREMLLQFGVTVECMIDGSLIATIARQGAATEQAIQAARCALLIKARLPGSIVALATGRAVLEQSTILGEVLGRVGTMIEAAIDSPDLPLGSVVIDETTSRLIESYFSVSRATKGLLLLDSGAHTIDESRPLLGMPTQCVGRERELTLLDTCFASCQDSGAATVILVSAPPGTGKSRLRHEFVRRLESRYPDVLILTGRGDPMTTGALYGLLSQALRRLFGIVDGEEIRIRQDKIRTRVAVWVDSTQAQRVAEFLGELCGTSFPDSILLKAARQDPRVMGDHLAQAFIDFLRSECQQHVVLLLLEDLHWGDALTVKLVDHALRELSDEPLMVLALARPAVEDLFPKLWAERARQDIRLGGLPKRACERLIQQVLSNKIDPKLQARIIEQSAGNALFLEELIRAVAEGKGDELPETILAVLHARLMRLVPDARRVLRAASVFGETFWAGGVRKLLGERISEQFESWLQALVDAEIIERQRESRFPGEVEYVFRHGLVREAAYGMLPDQDRLLGHYLAGCYLEVIGETDPMVLAEHFQRSGDFARAIVLYTRAAEKAYEGNDLEGVFRCAALGLSCGAEGETLGALYALQNAAWFWSNDLEKSVSIGLDALALLTEGTVHWFRAITWTTVSMTALGKSAQVSELALRFGTAKPSAEILGSYIEATGLLSAMLGLLGDRGMAEIFIAHALHVGGPVAESDPYVRGWMNYGLGRHANALQPRPHTAVEHFQIAVAAFKAIGDRRMIACSLGDLGLSLARIGALRQAEANLRDGLKLALRLGEPSTLTWVLIPLALLLVERPDPASQKEAQQLAADILSVTGESSYYRGPAHCIFAAAHCAAQDLEKAEEHARKALSSLQATQSSAPLAFIALGRVLLSMGRVDDAVLVATQGVELIDSLGGSGGTEVPLRMVLVEALRRQGSALAPRAQADLDHQIELRVQQITDPAMRASFLARYESRSDWWPLF